MKMSKHTKVDRLDRMVFIATTIEFGNILFREEKETTVECLTDTGIILVKARSDEDFLITAYIADINKATALFRNSTKQERLPQALYTKVVKNKLYHDAQNMGEAEREKFLRKHGKRA